MSGRNEIDYDDDAKKAREEPYRHSLYHYLCWYIVNNQDYGADDFHPYEAFIEHYELK